VAQELAGALADRGVSIVSGLAAGIDGAGHEATLARAAHGSGPIAVVGGGVDVVYPERHRRLWERVAEAGVLLSEAPPGARPLPWRFPQRNRIIAALSDVVVIVESPLHGGSMHTAEAANVIGVPLFAVPGSIRSPQSEGTNRLIADGALLLQDVEDVLVALGRGGEAGRGARSLFGGGPARADPVARTAQLSVLARTVHDLLGSDAVHVDDICERVRARLGEVVMALEELDEAGAARRCGAGWVRA
jgi:DNA processing protein